MGRPSQRPGRLPPALKSGLVWSLALTLPLKLVTAGTLSDNGSHWVGGTPSDAGSLAWMAHEGRGT